MSGDNKMVDSHYTLIKPKKKLRFPKPRTVEDQYDQPIGPMKPSTSEVIKERANKVVSNQYVKGAIDFLKQRSQQVAHEMQESPRREKREHKGGRKPESYDYQSVPVDPFMVGRYSGFGSNTNQEEYTKPRKYKRRKRKVIKEREDNDMYSIPVHLRHLF